MHIEWFVLTTNLRKGEYMKLCLKEIMKRIALLEQQKDEVSSNERIRNSTTYATGEEKIPVDYSFSDTRKMIAELDEAIRFLKHKLHYANATVEVAEFGMTLGECIIYMAQLNNEKYNIERMSGREQKTRRTVVGGVVEWTELNYDLTECAEALKKITETIMQLQLAIDRINLTYEIDNLLEEAEKKNITILK